MQIYKFNTKKNKTSNTVSSRIPNSAKDASDNKLLFENKSPSKLAVYLVLTIAISMPRPNSINAYQLYLVYSETWPHRVEFISMKIGGVSEPLILLRSLCFAAAVRG